MMGGWATRMVFLGGVCLGLTLAGVVPAAGGEDPPQPTEATRPGALEEAVKKAPGLRMDPVLFDVAAQFLPAVDVGEVFPTGAISSAQDGYVVQEYRVLDADAAEAGTFYRVRTLIGQPTRDVAICFDEQSRLKDVYDLRTPEIDEKATAALKTAPRAVPEGEDIPVVRFSSVPVGAVLEMMIGHDTASETMALTALLRGVERASGLAGGAGISEAERPKPAPGALTVTSVLPRKGTPVAAFAYQTLDGKVVSAAGLKGKPFVLFVTSLQTLQGITSEKALERRSAVMMSRVSRWMYEHRETDFVKARMLMVMTDTDDALKKVTAEGDEEERGLVVSDPKALATLGISVSPMLLMYGADGKLRAAYSCTSAAADYLKTLDGLAK